MHGQNHIKFVLYGVNSTYARALEKTK